MYILKIIRSGRLNHQNIIFVFSERKTFLGNLDGRSILKHTLAIVESFYNHRAFLKSFITLPYLLLQTRGIIVFLG
jgi:hypothetical protein